MDNTWYLFDNFKCERALVRSGSESILETSIHYFPAPPHFSLFLYERCLHDQLHRVCKPVKKGKLTKAESTVSRFYLKAKKVWTNKVARD